MEVKLSGRQNTERFDLGNETLLCFSESFLFQTCLEAPAMNGWLPQASYRCGSLTMLGGMLDPSGASATKL